MKNEREGMSLLEVVVVIAIIAILVALTVPAIQKARNRANSVQCLSNLGQIALAMGDYKSIKKGYPPARLCPAPWQNGSDPKCARAMPQNVYTGPNEMWWAPYDNRPGTDVTAALADYKPEGFLWPFVERNLAVFHCPEGLDYTAGSPFSGKQFQISYAMTSIQEWPAPQTGKGFRIWDHDDLPSCAESNYQVHFFVQALDEEGRFRRHYPKMRHEGTVNFAYTDGHASTFWPGK